MSLYSGCGPVCALQSYPAVLKHKQAWSWYLCQYHRLWVQFILSIFRKNIISIWQKQNNYERGLHCQWIWWISQRWSSNASCAMQPKCYATKVCFYPEMILLQQIMPVLWTDSIGKEVQCCRSKPVSGFNPVFIISTAAIWVFLFSWHWTKFMIGSVWHGLVISHLVFFSPCSGLEIHQCR